MARTLDMERMGRRLIQSLERSGPASSPLLCARLGISQSTFSRLVRREVGAIVRFGRARQTLYAARRHLAGLPLGLEMSRVDLQGRARRWATLHPIAPRGFVVEALVEGGPSGVFEGLPWFLQDLRPSGFLGRLVPRQHPDLDLGPDPGVWSDAEVLRYLAKRGGDVPGDWILGEGSLADFVAGGGRAGILIDPPERLALYPRLADQALAGGLPGSSAGGEQPKFLATLEVEGGVRPVLVKFSPEGEGPIPQRVADLLVCEQLALTVLAELGWPAAPSSLLSAGGRWFLEVERTDRTLDGGRLGMVSAQAAGAFVGADLSTWPGIARELSSAGLIGADVEARIRWLHLFGALIANSDMHAGNLSFRVDGARILDLAPVYDMLPMLYAPTAGELPRRDFAPPAPQAQDLDVWPSAWRAALSFWARAAVGEGISAAFRAIASQNEARLRGLEPALRRLGAG